MMTKTVTHELVIRDEGLTTECVGLRSAVGLPQMKHDHESEILYQETLLPPELSDRQLIMTMEAHEDQLARLIGQKWMDRK